MIRAARAEDFDLGRLGLSSGEGRRLELAVRVPSLRFGGERYEVLPHEVPVVLDIARMVGHGYTLRLRFEASVQGVCQRCLGTAERTFAVDAREIDRPGGGEELSSPYVKDEVIALDAWARDALVLALPPKIVCAEDCLGLCPECGEDLNEAGPQHGHERAPDPRWAALRELRLE